MEAQTVPRMSPAELRTRMTRGEELLVLDVRTEDALGRHPYQIPGARRVPLPTVSEHAASLPCNATIVTCCT
jgi:rhodanese-related sulfurtransferase